MDSEAHSATNSLHKIDWPTVVKEHKSVEVHDVVRTSVVTGVV